MFVPLADEQSLIAQDESRDDIDRLEVKCAHDRLWTRTVTNYGWIGVRMIVAKFGVPRRDLNPKLTSEIKHFPYLNNPIWKVTPKILRPPGSFLSCCVLFWLAVGTESKY